jgi:hypothetical protein
MFVPNFLLAPWLCIVSIFWAFLVSTPAAQNSLLPAFDHSLLVKALHACYHIWKTKVNNGFVPLQF